VDVTAQAGILEQPRRTVSGQMGLSSTRVSYAGYDIFVKQRRLDNHVHKVPTVELAKGSPLIELL